MGYANTQSAQIWNRLDVGNALEQHGPLTASELDDLIYCSSSTIRRILNFMVRSEMASKEGRPAKYTITDHGRDLVSRLDEETLHI